MKRINRQFRVYYVGNLLYVVVDGRVYPFCVDVGRSIIDQAFTFIRQMVDEYEDAGQLNLCSTPSMPTDARYLTTVVSAIVELR